MFAFFCLLVISELACNRPTSPRLYSRLPSKNFPPLHVYKPRLIKSFRLHVYYLYASLCLHNF
jgi:hypothetical protein